MSTDTNTSVGSRSISAFFDTTGAAGKAIDDLVAAGIPREHITRTNGADARGASTGDHRGFWDSLKDFFLPDEDRHGYAEGLRRGGTLVSVRADEANYTRVLTILDTDGAVDMDQRESEWRAGGWTSGITRPDPVLATTGQTSGAVVAGATALGGLHTAATDAPVAPLDPAPSSTLSPSVGAAVDRAAALDTSIERTVAAARRDDSHGRPRVRSYLFDSEPPAAPFSAERDRALIVEHMAVISADGQSIGEVDHLDGPDRIKLTKNSSPDGQHHFVPFAWIDHIDQHVHLRKTLAEIKAGA